MYSLTKENNKHFSSSSFSQCNLGARISIFTIFDYEFNSFIYLSFKGLFLHKNKILGFKPRFESVKLNFVDKFINLSFCSYLGLYVWFSIRFEIVFFLVLGLIPAQFFFFNSR